MTKEVDAKLDEFSQTLEEATKKVKEFELSLVTYYHAQEALEQVKEDNMNKELSNIHTKIDDNSKKIDGLHTWKNKADIKLATQNGKMNVIIGLSTAGFLLILGQMIAKIF